MTDFYTVESYLSCCHFEYFPLPEDDDDDDEDSDGDGLIDEVDPDDDNDGILDDGKWFVYFSVGGFFEIGK